LPRENVQTIETQHPPHALRHKQHPQQKTHIPSDTNDENFEVRNSPDGDIYSEDPESESEHERKHPRDILTCNGAFAGDESIEKNLWDQEKNFESIWVGRDVERGFEEGPKGNYKLETESKFPGTNLEKFCGANSEKFSGSNSEKFSDYGTDINLSEIYDPTIKIKKEPHKDSTFKYPSIDQVSSLTIYPLGEMDTFIDINISEIDDVDLFFLD